MEKIDLKKDNFDTLFTFYSEQYNKHYIVYLQDEDICAASYTKKDNEYVIDGNLTDAEFDMIEKEIDKRMEDINE